MFRCAEPLTTVLIALLVALGGAACGDEEGPFESPPLRLDTFQVKPLPAVPGETLTLSVTGEGLILGTITQGEEVLYTFVNGGISVTGTVAALSALPPVLVVRGIEGASQRADATPLP